MIQQGAACAAQIFHRGGVKNQDAARCRHIAVCRQCRKGGGGQVGLLRQQLRDSRVAHRLKRINAEGAFGDRHTVDVLHTVFRHAVHLGKCGQKRQLAAAAGVQQGSQLRAHVAAQGGIRLFIKVGEPGVSGAPHQTLHRLISLGGRQVARLGIHHQNVRVPVSKRRVCPYHHAGLDAARRKLHAGIQRPGEIVRDDQKNHRMSSFFLLFCVTIMPHFETPCTEKMQKMRCNLQRIGNLSHIF